MWNNSRFHDDIERLGAHLFGNIFEPCNRYAVKTNFQIDFNVNNKDAAMAMFKGKF
jgi:hypothetical protein